jgi:hypothetical protein
LRASQTRQTTTTSTATTKTTCWITIAQSDATGSSGAVMIARSSSTTTGAPSTPIGASAVVPMNSASTETSRLGSTSMMRATADQTVHAAMPTPATMKTQRATASLRLMVSTWTVSFIPASVTIIDNNDNR